MMSSKIIEKMIEYFQDDVRRINHALKVYAFSEAICEGQLLDDKTREIISYTAILHDIGIKESERKYNSSAGNYQEAEGPPVAKKILADINIPNDIIERVCFIIGHHHSYSRIDRMDFQIIVETDFLVNIYEDEIKRDAIENILTHIFKTDSGKKLLKIMYLKAR
jgi:HD superfamily phosphodiesterase